MNKLAVPIPFFWKTVLAMAVRCGCSETAQNHLILNNCYGGTGIRSFTSYPLVPVGNSIIGID